MPTDAQSTITMLEQELDQACAALASQQAMSRQQAEIFARTLAAQDGRVLAVRRTIASSSGTRCSTGRALRALPGTLMAIHRENLQRKAKPADQLVTEADPAAVQPFLSTWTDGGMTAVNAAIARAERDGERAAAVLAGTSC
ncbi:hypothetical protein OLX02_13450 [Novosphingobium sp. KCTC 2891]|uniref:hypothetical protein n=1 Tax=Novosphingobium sp. KCTC 2891 TaxID=2989730 RepID=UPI002221F6FC|nr:hypothetical protein [Novosphingobium sp. KCTC 2891]MCW1383826.1 hypothetical protein [Novosphingobium sp. KCTC 2891]